MKLLDRYVERVTLGASVLVAVGLMTLFSLLAFVEQLSDVGKGHYHLVDAMLYVVLTAPGRLLQLVPVSALLGCLLALGGLAGNNELIAMQASGVSVKRIIVWILKLGVPVMLVLFLIAQYVVPSAVQVAQFERASRLAPPGVLRSHNGFWAHGAHQYLNVSRFNGAGIPSDVNIYVFDDSGHLKRYMHAARADILDGGTWRLNDVLSKVFDNGGVKTEHLDSLNWKSFLLPEQVNLLRLPPESMAPLTLLRYVFDLHSQHQTSMRYEQALWRKLNIPLATLAMVLIAIPFVFGSTRAQSIGQRVTVGAVIGMVFTLSEQISGHAGLLLNLNPAVSVLAPSVVLLLVAWYLSRRGHRR